MITFQECWEYAALLEGRDEFTNHPDDPGGRTVWGITERDHPDLWANGPPSKEAALARWRRDYWNSRYETLSDVRIGRELLEAGLLSGPYRATRFIQAAYNTIRREDDVPLVEDGVYGPITEATINRFLGLGRVYCDALLNACNGEQYIFFKHVSRRAFMRGWVSKRITAATVTPG